MDTRIIAVVIASVLFIVIFWLSFKKSKLKGPINLLPTPILQLTSKNIECCNFT